MDTTKCANRMDVTMAKYDGELRKVACLELPETHPVPPSMLNAPIATALVIVQRMPSRV